MKEQGVFNGSNKDKVIQRAIEIVNERSFLAMKNKVNDSNAEEKFKEDVNYQFQKQMEGSMV